MYGLNSTFAQLFKKWRLAKDKHAFDQELLYIDDPALRIRESFGLPFELDETQNEIARDRCSRIIVNCCRQWGKTTTVAAKAATEAISFPGLILIIAPTERQSKELFRRTRDYLKAARPDMDYVEANKTSLELKNGSRIVALPARGENIRGFPNPRLVIVDEAAFVKDEDYRAIRPFLSHGGNLILLSTPFGKRGFFYEAWKRPDQKWKRYSVQASQCEHIQPDFLEEEHAVLGPYWYSQEYECQFLDNITGFFDMDAVRGAIEDGLDPLYRIRKDGARDYFDPNLKPLFGGRS